MANVTLYAIDNNEGECYCITFESREAANLFNDLWERFTTDTYYGAERMEEGNMCEDAKHVWTLAQVQACDDPDWDKLATNVSELSNVDNCDSTFKAVEVKESGVHEGHTACDYLILNRQTGERRWLRECISYDDVSFSDGAWEELEESEEE